MSITITTKPGKITLDHLCPGEFFVKNNELYMKTYNYETCVDIKNGFLEYFDTNTTVQPVKVNIIETKFSPDEEKCKPGEVYYRYDDDDYVIAVENNNGRLMIVELCAFGELWTVIPDIELKHCPVDINFEIVNEVI